MNKALLMGLAAGLLLAADAARAVNAGEAAPAFSATDTKGQARALSDFKGKYVVVEWTNPGCPYVQKHYKPGHMQQVQKQCTEKGVAWLTVQTGGGSKDPAAARKWNERAAAAGVSATALILDADGALGRAFGAKTTPHVFVISPEGKVIYQGAIDDQAGTDPAENAKAKNYVLAALEEAMAGKAVTTAQTQPYGCGVKY